MEDDRVGNSRDAILLNNPINSKTEKMESIFREIEKLKIHYSTYLNFEHFDLYLHDTWSLLNIGQDYHQSILEDSVELKKWRLFLLSIFSSNKMFQQNLAYFQSSNLKNYFIAVLLVKKFAEEFSQLVNKSPGIEQIHSIYYNIRNESQKNGQSFQQDLLNEIQNNWLKEIYILHQIYEDTLTNIMKQADAAEQILGEHFWDTLNVENYEPLICYLESNHFSEVLFWKEKFQKEKFLQVDDGKNSTFVFCVQQDISMRNHCNYQTALGLTVSEISREYQYDFIYVPFAQNIEQETIALRGNITAENYFDLSKQYSCEDGPINYKKILNFALTMLKLELSATTSGKIVFLCNEKLMDCLPSQNEQWSEALEQYKRDTNIEIIVIYNGDKAKLQPIWFADQIILGEDITVLI